MENKSDEIVKRNILIKELKDYIEKLEKESLVRKTNIKNFSEYIIELNEQLKKLEHKKDIQDNINEKKRELLWDKIKTRTLLPIVMPLILLGCCTIANDFYIFESIRNLLIACVSIYGFLVVFTYVTTYKEYKEASLEIKEAIDNPVSDKDIDELKYVMSLNKEMLEKEEKKCSDINDNMDEANKKLDVVEEELMFYLNAIKDNYVEKVDSEIIMGEEISRKRTLSNI